MRTVHTDADLYFRIYLSIFFYIYIIIQFVCLFVRDSGKNHCTGRRQTLTDYEVRFGKCPPRVKIAHLTVHEENRRFPVFLSWLMAIFNYRPSDFWLSGDSIGCHPTIKFKFTVVIATTLCCHQRRCARLAVAGEPVKGGLTC